MTSHNTPQVDNWGDRQHREICGPTVIEKNKPYKRGQGRRKKEGKKDKKGQNRDKGKKKRRWGMGGIRKEGSR